MHLPDLFTHEHDAILFAERFHLTGAKAGRVQAHRERVDAATERHFVRSLRLLEAQALTDALQASCTRELVYRLAPGHPFDPATPRSGILLTCAPRAHLALVHLLERDALFTAEVIGRVVRRIDGGPSW